MSFALTIRAFRVMVLRHLPPKSHTGQEEPLDDAQVNRRLTVVRVAIGLVFALFAFRLWQLQINQGQTYQVQAQLNQLTIVDDPAARGLIYARNGELLAHNAPSYHVLIVPAYLPDDLREEMAVYRRLAELIGIPASGRVAAALEDAPELPEQALATVRPLPVLQRLEVLGQLLERRMAQVDAFEPGIKEMVDAVRYARDYEGHPLTERNNADKPLIVSRETALIISEESLRLPGVRVQLVPSRQYPTGDLTAHVVGYTSGIPESEAEEKEAQGYIPGIDLIGLTGIEAWYEDVLRGQKGTRYVEQDANGRVLRELEEGVDPVDGNSIVLTLDLELQQYVTQRLAQSLGTPLVHNSQRAAAIVMDPRNGQILSLVSLPTFDNNLFSDGITAEEYENVYKWLERNPFKPFLNHAISGKVPPGSIYKIIPASAALQEGVLDRNTELIGEGRIVVPNKYYPKDPGQATEFVCWIWLNGHGAHGSLNVIGGLAHSCDIFFYKVGGGFEPTGFEGLGINRLSLYNRYFGLGQLTGIDLPGEIAGLSPESFRDWKRLTYGESWSTGDTYILSIGQGFLEVTPLQMLNATATVANGGILYRPQLLLKTIDQQGRVVQDFQAEVISHVPIDLTHLATVREGMEAAVEYGTADKAQVTVGGQKIRVAGKTGTAEFHCFEEELKQGLCWLGEPKPTHAWFTAFAPVEAPEIAVIVFVYNGGEGSEIAAPIARDILGWYFQRKVDIAAEFVAPVEPSTDSDQSSP